MCQACGFYKGRMVLDLATLKTARDARIKAKKERIRVEGGAQQTRPTETTEEVKEVATAKPEKKARKTRTVKTGISSKKEA